MSEILTTLSLTGEVTAVEVSDESLFSASNESGVWIVTAHQEFSSTEWMKVTVSDAEYEITVTESGAISSGLNGTDSSGYTGDREESVEGISNGAVAAIKPYSVFVEDGITGGTVTADKSQAVAGETVTVTVTPETEYELQTLTYTPADTGEPVTVSLPRNRMPEPAVIPPPSTCPPQM